MRTMFLVVLILILLTAAAAVVAQLPPEILADSYLLRAKQAIRDGDSSRAISEIKRIKLLLREHELVLSDDFHFEFAKVALSVGMNVAAIDSANRYLSAAGRSGRFYREALGLLDEAEQHLAAGSSTGNIAQLPPDIMVDRYLLQAERLIGKMENEPALEVMDNIVSLQMEHSLDLPDEFHYRYAKAADSVNLPARALKAVMTYLESVGRRGKHYIEAVELMNKVQSAVMCEGWNRDEYFETATMDQVTACLETGVNLGVRNESGYTPLHRAAIGAEKSVIVQALIAAGSDLQAQDTNLGATPLHLAAAHNENPAIVQALLAVGADLQAQDTILGATPLHMAAAHTRNAAVVQALLAAGADANAKDRAGDTALYYAAGHTAKPAVIEALLAGGSDPLAKRTRVETGQLRLGEEDTYRLFGRPGLKVILATQARDFNPNIIVNSPSGRQFYGQYLRQGKIRKEILTLSLDEIGEYKIKIYRFDDVDKGKKTNYTLHIIQDTPLDRAIQHNENLPVIQALFKPGDDLRKENVAGQSILHRAARYNGNPAVVHFLLSTVKNPMTRDALGRTPLHYAAHNENLDVIKALLETGIDPKMPDANQWSALHHAAAHNRNPAAIQILRNAGCDLEKKVVAGDYGGLRWNAPWHSKNYKPLHLAAAYNENPAVSQALLNSGAKVDPKGPNTYRPLHIAASYNSNPAVVRVLLAAGANLYQSARGDQPVHAAAMHNKNPAVLHALLQAGADLDAPGDEYYGRIRPVHYAARWNKNPAMLQGLLEAGADPNARVKFNKFTPLHYAAMYNRNPAVIHVLIKGGADLAAQDKDGDTPLQLASEYNKNPAVREVLLGVGAGQIESQLAAERARRRAQSGPGILGAAIGIIGGTAIAAAGGGSEEAVAAGTVFAEDVIGGGSPIGSSGGGHTSASANPDGSSGDFDTALRNLENSCGERYRSRFADHDHGRFYCLDAFARYCALKKGPNQQQLKALKHDFTVLRSQGMESRCPYFGVLGGTYNENLPIPELPQSVPMKEPPASQNKKRMLPTCADGETVPIGVAAGRKPGCSPEQWCAWDACRSNECRRKFPKCEPGVLQ